MPRTSGLGVKEVKTANLDDLAVTEAKLGALAVTEGKLGALAVTEGKLGASAVAQGKLKTTTASGSVAINNSSVSYTLVGGQYSWWTGSSSLDGVPSPAATARFGNGNVAAGVIGLFSEGNVTFYCDERYVQASPPYNNGPLFVHLAFDSNGKIVHSRIAPDPPWAYHGPTDITPQFWRAGKTFRLVKKINGLSMHAALRDPATRRALLAGTATVTEEEVEITLSYKDNDIAIVPHPFGGNDLTGLRVVMLKPGTALMRRLAEFCDCGAAREARELILAGELIIDNEPLTVPGSPPGVMVVAARLK